MFLNPVIVFNFVVTFFIVGQCEIILIKQTFRCRAQPGASLGKSKDFSSLVLLRIFGSIMNWKYSFGVLRGSYGSLKVL